MSSEDVTVREIFNVEDFTSDGRFCDKLTHKPFEIFLEDSLTIDAEFFAKCIQTTLGSYCLPAPIKDGHVSVTNLSDLVAMETHNRDARFRIKMHRSVTRLPVDILLDCCTHLGFDLTHVWEVLWGSLPLMHIS